MSFSGILELSVYRLFKRSLEVSLLCKGSSRDNQVRGGHECMKLYLRSVIFLSLSEMHFVTFADSRTRI